MSAIEISLLEEPLEECSPQLMPFHIAHTGPAPISTYFRPKPVPPPADTADSQTLIPLPPQQFTAAFRGRTVRGIHVDLPEPYTGIVLTNEDTPLKEKPNRKPAPKGRARRGKHKEEVIDIDALDDDDAMGNVHSVDEDTLPVKTLKAQATFSSFVLWNPDIPVDEGRDEYLRSLREWTRLSAAINEYEE